GFAKPACPRWRWSRSLSKRRPRRRIDGATRVRVVFRLPRRRRPARPFMVGSLVVHVAFVLALVVAPMFRHGRPPIEDSIVVSLAGAPPGPIAPPGPASREPTTAHPPAPAPAPSTPPPPPKGPRVVPEVPPPTHPPKKIKKEERPEPEAKPSPSTNADSEPT